MSIFAKLAASFSESRKELKKTSTLTCTALMLGVSLLVSTFTIVLNPYMKIGFSTVPIAIVGALFGPFVGGLAGGLGDILRFILRPAGMYFPGFTFDSIINGIIFGLFLYKKKPTIKNVALMQIVSTIVVSLILHNMWVCLLYGKAIAVILPASILKNFLKLPIDVMILYGLLKVVEQIKERAFHIPPTGGGGALDASK